MRINITIERKPRTELTEAPRRPHGLSPKIAVATTIVTFVVLGASLAIAAVPNGNTFNACRNKTTFAVRLIDPSLAQKCTTNETAVSWRTWKWRGAWSGASAYVIGDAVSYLGQSYTAVASSTNKAPGANPTIWNLLAAKGAPGVAAGLGTSTNLATVDTIGTTCVVSQILLIAGHLAPAGTMVADGSVIPITQNVALFSLIGTFYGGNGTSNFALPNLKSVAPNHMTYVICTSGTFP